MKMRLCKKGKVREPCCGNMFLIWWAFVISVCDAKTLLQHGKEPSEKIFQNNGLRPIAKSRSNNSRDVWRESRIVGGEAVRPGEYPWIVSIKWLYGSHFCGGFIYDSRHVISAAHCFIDTILHVQRSPSTFEVTVGEHYLTMNREEDEEVGERKKWKKHDMSVLSIAVHPDYDRKSKKNDIAVIRLQHNITWSASIQPAWIFPASTYNYDIEARVSTSAFLKKGASGVVAGWGWTGSAAGETENTVLRKVRLPIWEQQNCDRLMLLHEKTNRGLHLRKRSGTQFCAGGKTSRDSCMGDSGSPLMIDSDGQQEVIGIVSGGFQTHCGQSGSPGLYTHVGSYLSWIQKVVKSS